MKLGALAVLLLLSSCAMADRRGSGEDDLAAELAGRVAGEPRACINPSPQNALRVVDDRTLVYRQGRTLWVNRLRDACPTLDRYSTLIVEVRGGRYCNGDHVRELEPGSSIPGPICILGDFVPYTRR
jgi:hypothetical protein